MDVTRTIKYQGNTARVGALAHMFEQQGVRVGWTPPREQRGLGADVNEVIVNLVSTGSVVAITAAGKRFRERFPHHKVDVEGEEHDDGPAARPQ